MVKQFDLSKVPFSRFGSYFSLSKLNNGDMGKCLYLRVHCGSSPKAFKIDPVRDGRIIGYDVEVSPSMLRLKTEGGGEIDFVISGNETVRVRGRDVSLRLEMPAERWTFAYQIPGAWAFNFSPYSFQLALEVIRGSVDMDAPWEKGPGFCWETRYAAATISPDEAGGFEAAIDGYLSTWIKPDRPAFDICHAAVEREYKEWTKGLPDVSPEFKDARDLAAYVNWSAVLAPAGNLRRPTMFMSKFSMCNVYHWDHAFNAMAHCSHNPDLAWDQLILFYDKMDEHGKCPSSMNRNDMRYTISNPPVQGWALRRMWDENPGMMTKERMAEAYDYLSRWTDWLCKYRTWTGDRLPFYHHGFDSGWDNSSIFDQGIPVISPDQPAYLVLQMEVLEDLASAMGRADDAKLWRKRSKEMLSALLGDLWKEDHFVGIIRPSGKIVECQSLITCMPMVLGKRLPEAVRKHLVARIKEFLTPHGLATEKLDSQNYVEGGYWRGPIWPPSTMLVVHGLLDIGEDELAQQIIKGYCEMCREHGFYENFSPKTGEGHYCPSYTWTSSVFMIFAGMLR